jgi:hypothetical protein
MVCWGNEWSEERDSSLKLLVAVELGFIGDGDEVSVFGSKEGSCSFEE